MVDKVAPPFWVCWSAGLVIGLFTGDLGLWLIIGAVVGIALGFAMAAKAKADKYRAFHGTSAPAPPSQMAEEEVFPDMDAAA